MNATARKTRMSATRVVVTALVLGMVMIVGSAYLMKDMERPPTVEEQAASDPRLTDAELKTMTAFILNLNGLLCAEVTHIRPLEVQDEAARAQKRTSWMPPKAQHGNPDHLNKKPLRSGANAMRAAAC
jgi:hypothetical protein